MKTRGYKASACSHWFVVAVAFFTVAISARDASAGTVTVNTTVEQLGDNKCSLSEAMQAVNNHASFDGCRYAARGADTIVVPGGSYAETAMLVGTRSVTIRGDQTPGAVPTKISGNLQSQPLFAFNEPSGAPIQVVLAGLTIFNSGGSGATGIQAFGSFRTSQLSVIQCDVSSFDSTGIYVSGANLHIADSIIESNGNGVVTDANLTILDSAIHENTVTGISFYGSPLSGASSIINSTIAYNTGVGLYLANIDEDPTDSFTIYGSTIAFNTGGVSTGGGGVMALASNYNVTATIISNNMDANNSEADWAGSIATLDDSLLLSTTGTSPVHQGPHNLIGVDPILFSGTNAIPLWDGGSFYTPGVPLSPGSPAIDFLSSVSGQDQRHFPRGIAGGTGRSTKFDIGAMEFDPHIQGETLVVIPSQSGRTLPTTTSAPPGFSNGQASWLKAQGTQDFVSYQVPILHDFTFGQPAQVSVGVKKGNNEGIFTLSWAEVPPQGQNFVWHTLGTVDLYSSKDVFTTVPVGSPANLNTDAKYFRFQVTGKNRLSSGFQLFIDYIDLK